MKCPECSREVGYHALEKGPKGPEPKVVICPNTGRPATLDPRAPL